jgi:hypothetical protein
MPAAMVDLYGKPRKVSKAYLLGFSNSPFKDERPPASRPRPKQSTVSRRFGIHRKYQLLNICSSPHPAA